MTPINTWRWVIGGSVTGALLVVSDYLVNGMFLAEEWGAAVEANGLEPISASAILILVLMSFVTGLMIVWLYAAIRPRFGPGARTASLAGLFVWLLLYLWPFLSNVLTPVWPSSLFMTTAIVGLFTVMIATLVGCWIYSEKEIEEFVSAG